MKLLIDECVDERLRSSFQRHDGQTARYAKLAGLKNGELLGGAGCRFPGDHHCGPEHPRAANLADRNIAIVILQGPTNRIRDLLPLIPATLAILEDIQPGEVVRVSGGGVKRSIG